MNINSVVMTGRLTQDPQLGHTGGEGTAVCEFGIALNSRQKQGDNWTDRADFFDVVVYGRQAESCAEFLHKGSQAGISGRLRQERWETEGGAKRSRVRIVAREVQFLDPKGDGQPSYSEPEPEQTEAPDDIPF